MKDVPSLNEVVAVIRSYKNPGVLKQVKALRSFIPLIIVVINEQEDCGATKAWLAELNDPCVYLIEIKKGYTWTKALNESLQQIQFMNALPGMDGQYKYVFNVSVEARFERHHIESMLKQFTDEKVGAVGASFSGRCEGNKVNLGLSYWHLRNTGMLVRLFVFRQEMLSYGFSGFCDGIGGMEDIDFVCRMEVFTEMKSVMLDLKVPLIVGKHYNQPEKERREREAMDEIFNRYEAWADRLHGVVKKFGHDKWTNRLQRVIKKLS
ncbi:MAG TPA: hypothetical protein VMV71_03040 [Candidatus Paceibacterota bacterium]|nr:hypothetical protein [Candidatus Paceibacterota bacterium]